MKRFLPLFLCCALVLPLLAGCGKVEIAVGPSVSSTVDPGVFSPSATTTVPASDVAQAAMPQAELDQALDTLEYSGLAAILQLNSQTYSLEHIGDFHGGTVYLGDPDGDGDLELVFGGTMGVADRANGREYIHEFSQSGFTYYVDKNGIFYRNSGMGASCWSFDWGALDMPGPGWDPPLPESGNPADWVFFEDQYDTLYPNNAYAFSCGGEALYELFPGGEYYTSAQEPYYEDYSLTAHDGSVYINREANAYIESLGLQSITTTADDYLVNEYQLTYAQQLLTALDQRLASGYSGYQGMRQADVDGDGKGETLYIISDYLQPWRNNAHVLARDYELVPSQTVLGLSASRTVLLIADEDNGSLRFQALAAGGVHGYGEISCQGRFLTVGSGVYLLGGSGVSGATASEGQLLSRYLAQFGYTDSYFLLADLCDAPGQELVSYCYKDGDWYVLVIVIRNGAPEILTTANATDKAFYLVEDGGKTYLMAYNQGINSWNNTLYYSYDAYRFDESGGRVYLGSSHVSVKTDGSNAYEVSAFQQSFHKLLIRVIVIYDPFSITGSRYPTEAQLAYGQVAQQAQTQVGYVQLNDPSTWLHLRTGPGTQYDRVLIDPSDPESFIRQAHGSAVTILETIQTGDPANPVWVKIRIQYAGLEIIGYSSKTYIRIPGE